MFARAFYKALFARQTLGEAALAARQAVRERFPLDPSWLGYVVYGHPSARLRLRPTSPGS
jgi:hypothetical protein